VNHYRLIAAAVLALLVLASPAAAQRAAGPYSEVLGSRGDAQARQTLFFRASAYGAWDDMLTSTVDSSGEERFLRDGLAGGFTGSLQHVQRSRNATWESSGNGSMRIYGAGSDNRAWTLAGRTNGSVTINQKVSLGLSGAFAYSPYHSFAAGLDDPLSSLGPYGGGFSTASAAEKNISTDGGVSLTSRLSRRDSLNFSANARRSDFLDQADSNLTSYGGQASWRHTLTRNFGFHAGFGRDQVKYEFADAVASDRIDVGVDYGDTLTFTRRTALAFNVSTSATRWEDDTHYRVNGGATLTRGFGRSGSASLSYTRDTAFTAGFRAPLQTDAVSGDISDQLSRRSSWSARAGYTRGTVGFDADADHLHTVNAGGRVTTALTRHLSVYSDYTYYRYDVPAAATVFTFQPKFSRQSISVGLSLWAPIINDKRSPSDTR
jgi:hypothetical protein